MIITETKPFGMIKTELEKTDKISIIACNMCARMCETGGKTGLKQMKEKVKNAGYSVVDEFLLAPVCDRSVVKKRVKPKGNIIISLACDSGTFNIKKLFKDKKIISALNTHGLGAFDEDGNIFMIREFK
ncbi:MAG: hypothetical protein DRP13_01425 [Candidatus Aenigmatarchaeota archaeon]|nr:MAG: hypothetical protein DRP13_01425 [Candidatus Aenigmarchaeota archaeon]